MQSTRANAAPAPVSGFRPGSQSPKQGIGSAIQARFGFALIPMAVLIVLGGLIRLIAANTLTPHVDEASSLLAAHAVAERGLPILPSGTVYFQGAPLSYLLAPFVWLGFGDLDDLNLLRSVIVAAGTVTIYVAYRLGTLITSDARVGIGMAAMVAFDPLSVQWSGHLRMYGLLQVITFALVLMWVLLLARGANWKRGLAVVVLFWLAVFTHSGGALLGPAMFLSALCVHRKALLRQWGVLLTLAGSAAGAVTLMVLNQLLGSASVGDGEQSSSTPMSFVGDNLLAPLAISPDEWDWTALTRGSNLFWLVPGILVAVATLVGVRHLLCHRKCMTHIGVTTLLAFYWFPIVAVGVFTASPKERYLLNVHLLGYFFVAVMVVVAIDHWVTPRVRDYERDFSPLFAQVFSIAMVASLVVGLTWRLQHPVVHPDHNAAMEYVANHHEPGEPVIVALPAIGYLALDDDDYDDLYFLAGEQNQSRARRYTRLAGNGQLIDYWVGAHAMVDPQGLQTFLRDNPDAWIVVDEERLAEEWAYGGSVEAILLDTTSPVATTAGGGLILRPSLESTSANRAIWSMVLEPAP